jgi:hypothetical protein
MSVSLTPSHWIGCQRAIWERMFDAVDEYLESKKARSRTRRRRIPPHCD